MKLHQSSISRKTVDAFVRPLVEKLLTSGMICALLDGKILQNWPVPESSRVMSWESCRALEAHGPALFAGIYLLFSLKLMLLPLNLSFSLSTCLMFKDSVVSDHLSSAFLTYRFQEDYDAGSFISLQLLEKRFRTLNFGLS